MPNNRRDFLFSAATLAALGSAGAGAAAAAVGASAAAGATKAASAKAGSALNMRRDGSYETQDLQKPVLTLGVVQARIHALNMPTWEQELKANLDHMIELIDASFYYTTVGKPDILFFHEFPLTGWKKWTRAEILKFAITIPGPETEALAKKAKQYGCYIIFGSYVQDKTWPGHVLSITTIIGPDGSIVDQHWKARNIKGVFQGFELFTTTIYDVLEEYIERYGVDAVVPITRTPIGNIATSSVQREPELFRAMAFKGAELILRTASGGFTPLDIQATSLYNNVYTAVVNNAASPGNTPFFEDSGGGGCAIYGPDGKVLAEADGKLEQLIAARIPIAEFRARHRQPIVHWEMLKPVFDQYQSSFAPNLFSSYQPTSLEDAARYLKGKSRWK
jgi:predicted amidohydrolase